MLPLGDSPNPPGVPVVNYLLLGVNVALYLLITLPLGFTPVDPSDPALLDYVRTIVGATRGPVPVHELLRQTSAYDLFVFQHGFRPVAPAIDDLFFSMFLHGGFAHLAGNMLFLWIYGDNVEHRMGRVGYLLAYLGTGAAATTFHAVLAPGSPLPLVGASGAISGVLGFYFLWFPRNQVKILLVLFPILFDVVKVPARLLLGLYLVLDNILPLMMGPAGGGGVAHGAHIGGFLAGLGVAWLYDRRDLRRLPPEYARPARTFTPPAARIRAAVEDGRLKSAAEEYFMLRPEQSRGVLSPGDSLRMAGWLVDHGHPEAALTVFRRQLRDYPQGPGAAEAHLGAAMVQLYNLRQPTAAYQHLLDALDLDPSDETATRARLLLDEIERSRESRLTGFGRGLH